MDDEPTTYTLQLELPIHQAWALAELCKRIGWSDCRQLSISTEQCAEMIAATDTVRAALAGIGVRVR